MLCVVAESYTQRDMRCHIQRLKDLLSTNPIQQSMLGSDGATLTFLSAITLLNPETLGTLHHYGSCNLIVEHHLGHVTSLGHVTTSYVGYRCLIPVCRCAV